MGIARMRANLLSLTYRLRAVQFMLTGPAKALAAVVAAHQRLTTVFSDSRQSLVGTVAVAPRPPLTTETVGAAHHLPSTKEMVTLRSRPQPPYLDLPTLIRRLPSDRLIGS
jgi:hypothetical protein